MQKIATIIALSFVAGCAYNNYSDTTPTSKYENDTNRTLAGQSTSVSTEMTASYYEDCLARNRGYADAREECDGWVRAGRPGQMPQFQGWGWYPSYAGYGSGSGYNQWSTPGRPYGY
jgi:hypothetical protein